MNDVVDNAIAALEGYLRSHPNGHFSETAQLRLDQLLAKRGEKKVSIVSDPGNPFSKGTAAARTDYRVGDSYETRVTDLFTKIARTEVNLVTAVTDLEVIYNDGERITDLLGNLRKRSRDGARLLDNQFYPAEYAVGRKWSTRFRIINSREADVDVDFAVVGREDISVPAGTFDAFKVHGTGWNYGTNTRLEYTYWIAPQRVRRAIVFEIRASPSPLRSTNTPSQRSELVRFSERGS